MKMIIGAEVLKRSACDAPSFKFSSFYVKSRNKSGYGGEGGEGGEGGRFLV